MIVAQIHKLRWYAHVLRKVEKDLVKKIHVLLPERYKT